MGIKITIEIDDITEERRTFGQTGDGMRVSRHARFFNEMSREWTDDMKCNFTFLRMQERNATDMLKQKSYLFLNEVYDILGILRSKAGQIIGWIYDEGNPIGDIFVNFDLYSSRNEGFINGYDKSALLDFNVDGVILDKIL